MEVTTMGKTVSIFVLALFLVGMMPLALAQEGSSMESETRVESETRDGRMRERVETRQKIMEERKNVIKTRADMRQTTRAMVKARINYKEEVREFKELRVKLRECRGESTEECKDVRVKIKAQSKEHLLTTADKILELLERMKTRVENSKIENKAELLADIETSLNQVNELKVKIEALPADPQAHEVRDLAKQLRTAWKDVRHTIKVGVGATVNFGLKGVLVRAEKLEMRLDKVVTKLKAEGEDTSEAEQHIADYKTHLAEAEKLTLEAKAKFEAARTNKENFEADVKAGHELLVQARTELKEAHASLKLAVRTLKGLENGEETLEEETATVETEAQAEVGALPKSTETEETSTEISVETETEGTEVTVDSSVTGAVTGVI